MTQQAAKNTRHLSIRTAFVQHDNGSVSTQFRFVPGTGFHFFKWRNTWFQVLFIHSILPTATDADDLG